MRNILSKKELQKKQDVKGYMCMYCSVWCGDNCRGDCNGICTGCRLTCSGGCWGLLSSTIGWP